MKFGKMAFMAAPVLILLLAASAFAHGLNVFAWLENDQIITQCDFGKGHPAANASIRIYDNINRKELAQGRTNAQGKFTFAVPSVIRDGHGLLIVADAGQGHRGEWSMDASEIYAAASLTAGFDEAALIAEREGRAQAASPAAPQTPGHTGGHAPQVNSAPDQQATRDIIRPVQESAARPLAISPEPGQSVPGQLQIAPTSEQIRAIVHDALEQKLAPIRQQIASGASSKPAYIEIVGGIGWIVGLAGIVLFFMSRRKRQG